MPKYIYDTNALLLFPHLLNLEGEKIIPHVVLRELDQLKIGFNEIAFNAREVVRRLNKLGSGIIFDSRFEFPQGNENNDDLIIKCAKLNGGILVSGDFLVQLKARSLSVEIYDIEDKQDNYKGFLEIQMNDHELAEFYENLHHNKYSVLVNQYIIIKNKINEIIDTYKWNGNKFVQITNKNINSVHFGKTKALDVFQRCAFDSLFSNDITLLRGKPGSGKSLIALTYAISQLELGKYSRLVCLVNPYPVRNAQQIGFYPGDKDDKLLQSGIGNILVSKFGDRMIVEDMISTGKILLMPFADIRGYDSGENSIIWITEGQNLNIDLIKLGLQRIGDGSKIIIDGDDEAQVDSDAFSGINNGIRRMSKVFRGTDVYGEMTFEKIYRSKIATIADSM